MKNVQKSSMKELHPIISEAIRDGGQFVFYPSGTSMLPTIIPNEDCVVLVEATDLKKNDIVLFTRQSGTYVLHRIIDTENGEYTIMGDNQTWTEKIKHDKVIAKVSEIRKKNGKVLTFTEFAGFKTILLLGVSKFIKRVIGKLKRVITGKR